MSGQLQALSGEIVETDPLAGAPAVYRTPLDRPTLRAAAGLREPVPTAT